MSNIAQLETVVANELARLNFPDTPKALYEPMRYALASGGKHLRPVLALLCAELFAQRVDTRQVRAALALELFHCFSLIHDDIMDCADMRRGKPTVVARWGASTAILAGDAMLIEAYKLLNDAPRASDLQRTFSNAAIEVCEGQQLDMDFEQQPTISEEQYFTMIGKKTAALLAASATLGAQLANAPDEALPHIYQFAYQLGLAFQLRDDYLDVYASSPEFGKTLGGDIVAGKKTFLFVSACNALNEPDRSTFLNTMQAAISSEDKINKIKQLYSKANAEHSLGEAENECFERAMQSLEQVPATCSKEPLRAFADMLVRRQK